MNREWFEALILRMEASEAASLSFIENEIRKAYDPAPPEFIGSIIHLSRWVYTTGVSDTIGSIAEMQEEYENE